MNPDLLPENKGEIAMTEKDLQEFDIASNHPYECKCDLCKKWWKNVPEEDPPDEKEGLWDSLRSNHEPF